MPVLFSFLFAVSASSQDLGQEVRFGGIPLNGRVKDAAFETGPSQPLDPFEAVLVQGRSPQPPRIEIAVETLQGWGPWRLMVQRRYPNGRFWAKASPGRSRGRLRLRLASGGGWVELYDLQAVTLEPELSVRSPAPAPEPSPGPYHRRAEWGAKPPLEPFTPDEPHRFTVHHTAGPAPEAWNDSLVEMRLIQDFHQSGRGWNDIAYHFLIDKAGRVFEGRPQTVVGSHSLANNDGNLGICLMGRFDEAAPLSAAPDPRQLESLVRVARFLSARFGIPASTLRGHRDYRSTTCPGETLYRLVPELRRRVEASPEPPKRAALPWDPGRTLELKAPAVRLP